MMTQADSSSLKFKTVCLPFHTILRVSSNVAGALEPVAAIPFDLARGLQWCLWNLA
jgi:hypothetical protein